MHNPPVIACVPSLALLQQKAHSQPTDLAGCWPHQAAQVMRVDTGELLKM